MRLPRLARLLPLALAIMAVIPIGAAQAQSHRPPPAMLRDFSNADPGKKSGNGDKMVTTKDAQISGRCVQIDSNGNHISAAYPCSGGPAPTTCGGENGAVDGAFFNNAGKPEVCSTTALTWGGSPVTWDGVPITGL